MSLRSLAEQAFRLSGALHTLRFRQRRRLRILMYHRFPGSTEDVRARLEWQCRHLRRYFHPISLSEVARAAKAGDTLPPNSVAITVDDGYRDFALAAPIFLSFGFQPIVYVVSGFVDRETWLWPDQVKYLFEHTPLKRVRINDSLSFDLSTPEANAKSEQDFEQVLIRMPDRERLRTLEELPRIMETDLPGGIPEQLAPLGWDELRELKRRGVEVGAHTRTHPLVSRLESEDRLRAEVEGSKRRIEEMIEAPVAHFCYPNGTREDYDERAIQAVRRAGYETAVTTVPGLNQAESDRFQLSRIGVEPAYPPAYFERCVAGFKLV